MDKDKSMEEMLDIPSIMNVTMMSSTLSTTSPVATNLCEGSGGGNTPAWSIALNFYVNGVMTCMVTALGLIGNTLAVMVLTRRTMHTSTNCFLTALAIWDSVVLLISLLLISLGQLSQEFFQEAHPYVIVYLYPVGLVAQTVTVWLTVSFTVERYIAVCHPLKAASMCTIQRARIVIVVISVVGILYNLPRWFEYNLLHFKDPTSNATCLTAFRTDLAKNPVYNKIYFGWLYFLVMCFIPSCSLAVLNTFLIAAVKESQKQRKDMNVRQSRENNVTIMLVSVIMVFIVCQVPALIYNMAWAISMDTVLNSQPWSVLSTFRNFLVNLNSAVNFILYCALGQKFRRTFVRTFCICVARRSRDGFHSFTRSYNVDGKSKNGTVYMKMTRQKTVGRGDNNGGEGSGGERSVGGEGNGSENLLRASSHKSAKSDLQIANDQDSGSGMRILSNSRYSPQLSVDSSFNDGVSNHEGGSSGDGKRRVRNSECQLLPNSREMMEGV